MFKLRFNFQSKITNGTKFMSLNYILGYAFVITKNLALLFKLLSEKTWLYSIKMSQLQQNGLKVYYLLRKTHKK